MGALTAAAEAVRDAEGDYNGGMQLSTWAAQARRGQGRPLVCRAANHPSHPKSYDSGHCIRCSASKMEEE